MDRLSVSSQASDASSNIPVIAPVTPVAAKVTFGDDKKSKEAIDEVRNSNDWNFLMAVLIAFISSSMNAWPCCR